MTQVYYVDPTAPEETGDGTEGSPYASLREFALAREGDFNSATEDYIVNLLPGEDSGSLPGGAFIINSVGDGGSATPRKLTLRAMGGNRHTGVRGSGYRNVAAGGVFVVIINPNVTVEYLGLASHKLRMNGDVAAVGLMDSCLSFDSDAEGFYVGGGIITQVNCAAYGAAGPGFYSENDGSNPTVKRINCTSIGNGTYGFERGGGGNIPENINCYSGGNGTEAYNGSQTLTNCAHDTATSFTGSTGSTAYDETNFRRVTPGEENGKLPSTSSLISAGVGNGSDGDVPTTDFEGDDRGTGSTSDLGFDQFSETEIVVVQKAVPSGSGFAENGWQIEFDEDPTPGNTILVTAGVYPTDTPPPTISDSEGNEWDLDGASDVNAGQGYLWRLSDLPPFVAPYIITIKPSTPGPGYTSAGALEVEGILELDDILISNGEEDAGDPINVGPTDATTNDDALAIAVASHAVGTSSDVGWSVPADYLEINTVQDVSANVAFQSSYKVIKDGGPQSVTWFSANIDEDSAMNFILATYKKAAGELELIIGDATHAQSADNLALTQENTATLADATHGQTADNLTLSVALTLAIQNALHSHTVDGPGLIGVEQHSFRWYNDDGNESAATAINPENIGIVAELGVNKILRLLLNGIGDPASVQYQLEYKRSTDPSYIAVPLPLGASTITFGAAGSSASGTTSCTPSYPSGISASTSDLICAVTGRSSTANTAFTMPAGWTKIGELEGGTGSYGVDTGTRRVTYFIKDTVSGSESGTVTVSLAGDANNTLRATIFRVERVAGYTMSYAIATAADVSLNTTASFTASSTLSFAAGDLLMVLSAGSTDTATMSSVTVTATNVTFGTRTSQRSDAVTNGFDHRHILDSIPVSSVTGTPVVAPVYGYTASANTSGAAAFLVLRAVPPAQPVTVSPSSNISASGVDTTARMTAPAGKTTSDFVAGRLQDDENPADAVNITADDYTEIAWSVQFATPATDGHIYQFRVTANGTPLALTTVTPTATIGDPTIDLIVSDATHGQTADGLTLSQANTLVVADALHALSGDNVTLASTITLAIADALHAHTADALALIQANVLAVLNALHAQAADELVLTQAGILVIQDALQAHLADNVVLSQANVLSIADALHGQLADSLVLTQAAVLAIADALHAHLADDLALSQASILVVQDALHALSSDSLALSQANVLAIADAIHAQPADNLVLTQAQLLAIQEALHAHLADNVVLSAGLNIAVQNALHGQSADTLTLTQANLLAIADALHALTSDSLVLSQAVTIAPADSAHTLTSDNLALIQGNILAILDALHLQTADTIVLLQANTLTIGSAHHGQTADNLALSAGFQLAIQDAAHGLTSDNLALLQGFALAISRAVHAQSADGVVLTQSNILVISDALHAQIADRLSLQLPAARLDSSVLFVLQGQGRVYIVAPVGHMFTVPPQKRN